MSGSKKLVGENLAEATRALKEVTKVLDELGIPYIVDCGTLLGIIRENRLLPWDDDIDLTIQRKDIHKLFRNRWKIWLKGFRTHVRFFKRDIGPYKKGQLRIIKVQSKKYFIFKKYNIMDIFVKDHVDDSFQMIVGDKPAILQSIPDHFLFDTIDYEFENQNFKIPKEYENYLTFSYGDWRTPKKKWDFQKESPTNIASY